MEKNRASGMRWIGLTGGIASGKSTVAVLLKKRGFPVVDADQLAHKVLEPGSETYTKVVAEFGKNILDSSGRINRRVLGEKVFGDEKKLRRLESFIHPAIRQETERQRQELARVGTRLAFYDVPLLFEKNLEGDFQGVLLVTCSEELQRARLKSRNNLNDEEVNKRLAAQIPLIEKEKHAKWIIRNEGSLDELEGRVEDFLAQLGHQAQL